jgi:polyisoprenoid-binding protein YceI
MMKKLILLLVLAACSRAGFGQLYFSRTAFVGFYSTTPLEDIRGENNQVLVAVDLSKKTLAFTALLKGFIFPKELMQEHFNENYVESDKYPKTTFAGSFTGDVDPSRDGRYPIEVKGQLTLHNIVKEVEVPAVLEVKGTQILATAKFMVTPEDFHIDIPSVVRNKIAKQVTVDVRANCNPK